MRSARPLPRARGGLLLGVLSERLRLGADFYGEMAARHGDVCSFRLAAWEIVLVSRPDLVHSILKERAGNYRKGSFFDTMRLVLGDGLFFSEGESWRRQRSVLQPAFHRARLAALVPAMQGCLERALPRFDAAARSGAVLDLHGEMVRLTLDVAARTLFGAALDDRLRDAIGEAVDGLSRLINQRMFSMFQGLPLWVPLAMNLRTRALVRALDALVVPIIEERVRRPHAAPSDLLDALLLARDDSGAPAFSPGDLRDQVMTFLLAGHETTASGLSWTFKLLCENPDSYQRLLAEAAAWPHAAAPDAAALEALPVCKAVFSEALRLYPPGWTLARQAVEEDDLNGHYIPAGANLIVCPYALHRDRRWFDDPLAFRPERFPLQGDAKLAYLPFGAGARACIGAQLATLESVLVLAQLGRRYRFTLDAATPITLAPLVTLRPMPGVPVRVTRCA